MLKDSHCCGPSSTDTLESMDLLDRLRLDVPIAQAGMGGGLAGSRLAGAVAAAGALGTIGILPPEQLRLAIGEVRAQAPDRAVAVNLLMPFTRRGHIQVCIDGGVDVAVLFFGGNHQVVSALRDAGIFVLVQVGTDDEARDALGWGADGLIAQGVEAGGHLRGTVRALDFLPRAIAIAGGRPVLLAGGIATGADVRVALDAGAAAVVAGTRFLMTKESGAHRVYKERLVDAESTVATTLFGLGWPARHRVLPNAATRRWCDADGKPRRLPAALNAWSGPLGRIVPSNNDAAIRLQWPRVPMFSPLAPLEGMPERSVDAAALYAGESAIRIADIVSARDAVDLLAGR